MLRLYSLEGREGSSPPPLGSPITGRPGTTPPSADHFRISSQRKTDILEASPLDWRKSDKSKFSRCICEHSYCYCMAVPDILHHIYKKVMYQVPLEYVTIIFTLNIDIK